MWRISTKGNEPSRQTPKGIRSERVSTPKRGTLDLTSVGASSPLGYRSQLSEYNYDHFRPKHLLADLWKTARGEGIQPGEEARESLST